MLHATLFTLLAIRRWSATLYVIAIFNIAYELHFETLGEYFNKN